MTFGSYVKRWRIRMDLTQATFARRGGLSISSLQKIEADAGHEIRRDTMEKLAAAMVVPIDRLNAIAEAIAQDIDPDSHHGRAYIAWRSDRLAFKKLVGGAISDERLERLALDGESPDESELQAIGAAVIALEKQQAEGARSILQNLSKDNPLSGDLWQKVQTELLANLKELLDRFPVKDVVRALTRFMNNQHTSEEQLLSLSTADLGDIWFSLLNGERTFLMTKPGAVGPELQIALLNATSRVLNFLESPKAIEAINSGEKELPQILNAAMADRFLKTNARILSHPTDHFPPDVPVANVPRAAEVLKNITEKDAVQIAAVTFQKILGNALSGQIEFYKYLTNQSDPKSLNRLKEHLEAIVHVCKEADELFNPFMEAVIGQMKKQLEKHERQKQDGDKRTEKSLGDSDVPPHVRGWKM